MDVSSSISGPFGPSAKLAVRMVGRLCIFAVFASANTLLRNSDSLMSCTANIVPVWWSIKKHGAVVFCQAVVIDTIHCSFSNTQYSPSPHPYVWVCPRHICLGAPVVVEDLVNRFPIWLWEVLRWQLAALSWYG